VIKFYDVTVIFLTKLVLSKTQKWGKYGVKIQENEKKKFQKSSIVQKPEIRLWSSLCVQ